MCWWVIWFGSLSINFTIFSFLVFLFSFIISTWISLKIINLTLHHLLISQILCIRIIDIIVSLLNFVHYIVQLVLSICWFQMNIWIADHTQWLTHWIPFHYRLSSHKTSNRLIILEFLHWSSLSLIIFHLNCSKHVLFYHLKRPLFRFRFSFWNHLWLVLFLHKTIEEWCFELLIFLHVLFLKTVLRFNLLLSLSIL